jgi:hypothetical protein
VTSAADDAVYSVSDRGSVRWSTNRIVTPSIRNAVRKTGPVSPAPVASSAAATGAGGPSRRVGSRSAPASSPDVRWRAWAAPRTVAAVDAISPANSRKNRRRARSAPSPVAPGAAVAAPGPGADTGPSAAVPPSGATAVAGDVSAPGSAAVLAVGSAIVEGVAIAALVGSAVST